MSKQAATQLIANTLPRRGSDLTPIRRELGKAAARPTHRNASAADPFSVKDRTIDQVVDRLLKELTW